MMRRLIETTAIALVFVGTLGAVLSAWAQSSQPSAVGVAERVGVIRCANLIYARGKTSVCFADKFLQQITTTTHVQTHRRFAPVRLEAEELFEHPFAVMSGDGPFKLSDKERENFRLYLQSGGFIVASAGCSSKPWNNSLRQELKVMFPGLKLTTLGAEHPVFHTVYDITSSKYKKGGAKLPDLRGLEIDGRIVLIWSPDGLNDSKNSGPKCCCCGGNEIKSAIRINVNLLVYALTH